MMSYWTQTQLNRFIMNKQDISYESEISTS